MVREYHILSLSGGKDSTALAFFMRDNMPEIFEKMELVFYDTGCDLKETYDYLNKIKVFLGKDITYIKPERSFEDILYKTKMIPTIFRRWCTIELKIKPSSKFLQDKIKKENYHKIKLYIGIRADEQYRSGVKLKTNFEKKYIEPVYPLIDNNLIKEDIENILINAGINYPSYYDWRPRNGCYFCPFQTAYDWVMLFEKHPDLYYKAIEYEKIGDIGKNIKFRFNPKMTLEEILEHKEEIKKLQHKKIKTANEYKTLFEMF